MKILTQELQPHWVAISSIFSIQNEEQYDKAVEVLNILIDEVGTNEKHPLYSMLDTLGTVMYAYEEKHHSIPEASGADMLDFFMEEHELSTQDLPELGSESMVNEILEGRRILTVPQIRLLATRFHVSPTVFI